LREAVRLDTQFAMAYRKLGVALSNSGMPRPRVDSALERAYRFRDRLTERERLLAEGTYYQLGPGRDRRRAIRAYEALLAIDPNETGAANNLASILSGRREFARAESLFKRMIASGRATSQQYTNLISVLFNGGKVEEAEKLTAEFRQRFPQSSLGPTAPVTFLYQRDQFDSMYTVLRELERSSDPILKVNGVGGLASYSLLRGRIEDALRYGKQAQTIARQFGGQPPQPINDSLSRSFLDISYYDDTSRAIRRMEAVVAKGDWKQVPFDFRPYSGLVSFFAAAGQPQRARALLTQYQAEIPDSTVRRIRQPEIHGMQGAIAISEKRYSDAVREFWKADTTYDGPDGNCAICVLDDIGWAWNYAGVADSAIYYWEKYLATPYYGRQGMDASQRVLIVKRLGELYDAKGDVANAAKRYREFLKLWENADARLQPKVNEVRRKLSRLADTERKS
jgi:tetratricopeptide (TPR) repeat protein